jgi:hypothetical protein
MIKVLNIKADGSLNIILGNLNLVTSTDDPLLPASIAQSIASAFASLSAQGASEIHMEQDTFRTFTHTVKGGLVEAQDSITDPVFAAVIAAKADLANAYVPQPTESSAET